MYIHIYIYIYRQTVGSGGVSYLVLSHKHNIGIKVGDIISLCVLTIT